MEISYKTRPFYQDEQRLLRTLKTRQEKEQQVKIKFHYFLVAGAIAAGFGWLASIVHVGFLVFIFGTIAVIAVAFLVFAPSEIYKAKKRKRAFMAGLDHFINSNAVATCHIKATRIAVAKEYEDEGDLIIIEIDSNNILFLHDYDYTLRKRFPCLDFEIYEEKFTKLLGRMVYSLSERIIPLAIDKKAKWNYLIKVGSPGHLEIRKANFDELVDEINSYGQVKK